MANHIVTVQKDAESDVITVLPSTRTQIVRGDTVTFQASSSIWGPGTVTLSNFLSGVWTNSANGSLGAGGSFVRTVKSDATLGNGFVLASQSGYTSDDFDYEVLDILDATPDAFSLGPDASNQEPNVSYFYTDMVVISGVNTTVSVSVTNGEALVGTGQNGWLASQTAENGLAVRVRYTSAADFGQSKTITLTIGGTSDSLVASTKAGPDTGEIIFADFAAPFDFSDIEAFFGHDGLPNDLDLFLRGGGYVPDIVENAGVPTSPPIEMGDLIGSATTLYFEDIPGGKSDERNTTSSPATMVVTWTMGTDWNLGFGLNMNDVAEKRYSFTVDTWPFGRSASDVTMPFGSTSWGLTNNSVSLEADGFQGQEGDFTGTLTIEVRHPTDPAKIESVTVGWSLSYYGV